MANRKMNLRDAAGLVLCATLSLAAFLILLSLSDQLPAILVLTVSLICPLIWLALVLGSDGSGGGLAPWAKHRAAAIRSGWGRNEHRPAGVLLGG